MGVLDFLFEGKPPKSVTTYGTATKDIPQFLSDYTQGVIAKANAVAAEPYQIYQGPRISGFKPDEEAAFEAVRQNMGRADPYTAQARGLADASAQINPLNAAAGYLQQGSQAFPENVDRYMNPYVQNVLNRQESLAERTLNEKFLPQLKGAFTRSGQFGSSEMQRRGLQGVRDITENLEEQRLATLGDAYNRSADIFGADQGRQIQAGQATGQLAGDTQRGQIAAAQQLGALGEFASAQGYRDAAAREAVGTAERQMEQGSLDLAYQDFLKQRDYPKDQLGFLSNIVRGLPYSEATTESKTGPASVYGPSPLSQIGSAVAVGKGLQDLTKGNKRGGLAHVRRSRYAA